MANLNLASLAANHSVPLKSGNACPFSWCSSLQWLRFFSGFSFRGISMLGVCWMGSLRNPAAGAPGLSGWIVREITSYQNTGNEADTSALSHWCSKRTLSLQTVTEKRLKKSSVDWRNVHGTCWLDPRMSSWFCPYSAGASRTTETEKDPANALPSRRRKSGGVLTPFKLNIQRQCLRPVTGIQKPWSLTGTFPRLEGPLSRPVTSIIGLKAPILHSLLQTCWGAFAKKGCWKLRM